MTVSTGALNIGVIGAGGFANFAARCFVAVDGISITAVADTNLSAASAMAAEFAAKTYAAFEDLLADPVVDLVYIATPPNLHFRQSQLALLAGKHVICEKPAALSVLEAEQLVDLSRSMDKLYVVNLMQRYNPLFGIVKTLIERQTLGEFTHGFFENYASDEFLGEDHWFWNEAVSGGIFIEHGVHFFDLFEGWLGRGELAYAAKWKRYNNEADVHDRVMAVVNYEKGPVTFYHGFDQPKILDRQEMRLQFEKGDITLYGWVPVRLKLNGLVDATALADLRTQLPDAEVRLAGPDGEGSSFEQIPPPHEPKRTATGRFKPISYDYFVTADHGSDDWKMSVYAELLQKMIADQWAWIVDNSVKRLIAGDNAIESVRVAETATQKASTF